MKYLLITSIFIFSLIGFDAYARGNKSGEQFGKTANIGLGLGGVFGYSNYVRQAVPVFHFNYEFDVARNFTLAPFISFYTYRKGYYWGDKPKNHPYKYYHYRETVIPMGGKATYYFDELLKANSKWDFYLAGSLGFVLGISSWDSDYHGDEHYYRRANPLFLNLHIGAEYHISSRIGLFLDLSSGLSTIGIAIH